MLAALSALYFHGTLGFKAVLHKDRTDGPRPAAVTAQPTIWINTVFIVSFRGVSVKVMWPFPGHQQVEVVRYKKSKKDLCAAICFVINNGWVTALFKIIKLLDSSKMETCAYTQKWWN